MITRKFPIVSKLLKINAFVHVISNVGNGGTQQRILWFDLSIFRRPQTVTKPSRLQFTVSCLMILKQI